MQSYVHKEQANTNNHLFRGGADANDIILFPAGFTVHLKARNEAPAFGVRRHYLMAGDIDDVKQLCAKAALPKLAATVADM